MAPIKLHPKPDALNLKPGWSHAGEASKLLRAFACIPYLIAHRKPLNKRKPNLLGIIQLLLDVRDDPQGLDVMVPILDM